ncbi:MAG: CoA transferase [Acidimicrobiia bacterium]|nr:CoA transferase [Acidimicrobiia bacterium]
MARPALEGLRIVEVSTGIPGGYCTRLLADLGADVLKVEPPGGDPLRRRSASGPVGRDGHPDGALFRHLAAGKRSVVCDPDRAEGRARLRELAGAAHVVVESSRPGVAEELGLDRLGNVLVSITPFGRGGPDSGLDASEFLLQARCGSTSNHGEMAREPLACGGRLGEWAAGAFGAAGALTALARWSPGDGEHVDVSILEVMALCLVTVPTVMFAFPGGQRPTRRWVMIPGIEPCADGYVGITTVTRQQWLAFLSMMGRDDLLGEEDLTTMLGRKRRTDEVNGVIRDWTTRHRAAEIVEAGERFRVPASFIGNGATFPRYEHSVARGAFGRDSTGLLRPGPSFRLHGCPPPERGTAPRLGEHEGPADHRGANGPAGRPARPARERPLDGLRVLDFTAFWSGPFAGQYLATMGADVVKVESVQRPDGMRFSAAVPPTSADWHELSALFHASNLGKRGVTLNLSDPEGQELVKRLVAHCDVVVENFTPRVLDGFGLGYEALAACRPDLVMVRIPGFGLDGPWRDRPGFAQTMEQLTGMAWVNGYEGDVPIVPGGVVDPLAGIHAVVALLAALEHRDRTGEGQLVEVPMIDVAGAVTAEQVVEHDAYGVVLDRHGNRGPEDADRAMVRCDGDDEWVAVEWDTPGRRAALVALLGDPGDVGVALGGWCAKRSPADAEAELRNAGVPAAAMVSAHTIDADPQMRARGFFETVSHPVAGDAPYPGWPVRFSKGPHRWYRSPAPTLGQHNAEVLGGLLGLDAGELARLEGRGVTGSRPVAG